MMHRLRLTLAALAMAAPSLAFGQQLIVHGLAQGMLYEDARRIVLRQGWQADINNPTQLGDLQLSLQSYFLQRGFTEIEHCLPTGLGTCRAGFHNADGQTLYLFTGEPDDADTRLTSWCLGSRNRDCAR